MIAIHTFSIPSRPSAPLAPGVRGLVLHAAWLTSGGGRLALWAEAETKPVKRRGTVTDATEPERGYRSHPFCAKPEELWDAFGRLWKTSRPGVAARTSAPRERIEVRLPRLGSRPVPSPEYVARQWAPPPEDGEDAVVSVWRVNALLLDAESACVLLAGLSHEPGAAAAPAWVRPNPFADVRTLDARPMLFGADLRYWAAAARLAMRLVLRQRYLPAARESQALTSYMHSGVSTAPIVAEWRIAPLEPDDQRRFDTLVAAMPDAARAAVDSDSTRLVSPPWSVLDASRAADESHGAPLPPPVLLNHFCASAVNALLETWTRNAQIFLKMPLGEPETPRSAFYYYSPRYTLTSRWLEALSTRGRPIYLNAAEARALLDGVERWLSQLDEAQRAPFRLCLRLSAPEEATDGAVWDGDGDGVEEGKPDSDASERASRAADARLTPARGG